MLDEVKMEATLTKILDTLNSINDNMLNLNKKIDTHVDKLESQLNKLTNSNTYSGTRVARWVESWKEK
jgi:hypothetical protein